MLLLFAIPAAFVGNQACAACHGDLVKAYAATPMAISSGRVSGVVKGGFRQASSGVQYDVDASGLVHYSRGAAGGQHQLDYFIGSGAQGRSFLYQRGGFLFEAPLTWYTHKQAWDASPGYESDTAARWNRAVDPTCFFCHASQMQPRAGTQNGYRDPPFLQDGVSCERCHGPGSLHIRGEGAMVNPAKLDPVRRDGVCAQCHLSGEARALRSGAHMDDYRPGDLLSDVAAYFVVDDKRRLQVNSHVEKLAQSACKRAAGDKLACITCHDPHRVPAAAERAGYYRARCQTCHEPAVCQRGPDCVSCHMPKMNAADARHGVFTDHSIPRVPTKPATSSEWRLRPFTPADSGDRELGLAYAELAAHTGDRRQQAEAIRLLTKSTLDGDGKVRLAHLLEAAGAPERAAALYREALREDPSQIVAMVNLGRLVGSQGMLDQAIALWREALQRNPCLEEAATNLQIAYRAQRDFAAADQVRASQSGCIF